MERRRRIRAACIVALVLALHLGVVWFLANSRVLLKRVASQGLEIVFIAHPAAPPEQSTSSGQKSSGRKAQQAVPPRQASSSLPSQQPAVPEENNAIHPPVDWASELSRAAKNATADKASQTPRDFGFPHLPSAPSKAPEFDWDYAATHRVESIEGGGLVVHLNDNCVLVLFPLPFMGCGIGKKPANGELLKHMGDPTPAAAGPAP